MQSVQRLVVAMGPSHSALKANN